MAADEGNGGRHGARSLSILWRVTSPPDAVAALLIRRSPWPVRVAAYGLLLLELGRATLSRTGGMDNLLVVQAVRIIFSGGTPYESKRFLYPPSSIPFALLEAPASDTTLRRIGPFIVGALLLIGWWAALRLFDIGLGSWLGVLPVGMAGIFVPASSVIGLSSWTAPIVAAMGVALLLMGRGRWLAAGVVVGVSIAVKPMLVPLGLIFLLNRRWAGLAAAAGIPVLVTAVVLPLLPKPGLFFTATVPFLLSGQDNFARLYDASLPAVLPRLDTPAALVVLARLAVAVVTVAAAVWRWRRGDDQRLRLVETSCLLMIGVFLVSTPAFPHYAMVVLPALVASLVVPGSVARTVWFWIALLPGLARVHVPGLETAHRQVFKIFILFVLLYGTLLWSAARRRPRSADAADDVIPDPPARSPMIPAARRGDDVRPAGPARESVTADPVNSGSAATSRSRPTPPRSS